ncbi:MAG: hypothetical protein ACREBC_35250 [Pyrinomonadaceae bacterium]
MQEYKSYFDDFANRKWFEGRYPLTCFKPQVAVVIGRGNFFSTDIERAKLQDKTNVKIVTYDDLITLARHAQVIKQL